MTAFDFVRGPGLHWAIVAMVAGLCWRIADFAIRPRERDLYWARKGFHRPSERWHFDSHVMHAGLIIAVLGFSPHILLIRELTGFVWPALPIAIVLFAGATAIVAMVAVLAHRAASSQPSAFSAFDDYFSWSIVFAAMVTGMLAYPHVGGASAIIGPYRALLTAHLATVELLMIWMPIGKLGHVAMMPILGGVSDLIRIARGQSRDA